MSGQTHKLSKRRVDFDDDRSRQAAVVVEIWETVSCDVLGMTIWETVSCEIWETEAPSTVVVFNEGMPNVHGAWVFDIIRAQLP